MKKRAKPRVLFIEVLKDLRPLDSWIESRATTSQDSLEPLDWRTYVSDCSKTKIYFTGTYLDETSSKSLCGSTRQSTAQSHRSTVELIGWTYWSAHIRKYLYYFFRFLSHFCFICNLFIYARILSSYIWKLFRKSPWTQWYKFQSHLLKIPKLFIFIVIVIR